VCSLFQFGLGGSLGLVLVQFLLSLVALKSGCGAEDGGYGPDSADQVPAASIELTCVSQRFDEAQAVKLPAHQPIAMPIPRPNAAMAPA
jgi:hypothetical protein